MKCLCVCRTGNIGENYDTHIQLRSPFVAFLFCVIFIDEPYIFYRNNHTLLTLKTRRHGTEE